MADKLVVLVQRRDYSSPIPMTIADLTAFISAMARFSDEVLHVPAPTVVSSQNGEWIKFEFDIGDR